MDLKKNQLLDNHIMVLDQLKKIQVDDFFYTRLKSRLKNEKHQDQFYLPIKPVFILSCLGLILILNILFLDLETFSKMKMKNNNDIEQIISMYDQKLDSLY